MSSTGPHSKTPSPRLRVPAWVLLSGALAILSINLAAPSVASAAFTRPFLTQITETEPGASGLAVDGEDHPWLSSYTSANPPFTLDEFESTEPHHFLPPALAIEGKSPPAGGLSVPTSLAIAPAGDFYTAGRQLTKGQDTGYVEVFGPGGAYQLRFGPFEIPRVAVDDSAEPSAGTVYVASQTSPAGYVRIEKFGPTGTAEDFSRADEPNPPSYLSANRITLGSSLNSGAPAIAVGPHGEIYLAGGAIPSDAVQEYAPSGVLIRTFSGAETPGIGLSHNHGGFGGEISAVAVDPTSGDVLVSAHAEGHSNEGAIDEFDSSGHFLGQITEASPGQPLPNPEALALDSHGHLYVVNDTYGSGTAIIVLAAGVFVPDVSLAAATQRTPSAAILNGTRQPRILPHPEEPPTDRLPLRIHHRSPNSTPKASPAPRRGSPLRIPLRRPDRERRIYRPSTPRSPVSAPAPPTATASRPPIAAPSAAPPKPARRSPSPPPPRRRSQRPRPTPSPRPSPPWGQRSTRSAPTPTTASNTSHPTRASCSPSPTSSRPPKRTSAPAAPRATPQKPSPPRSRAFRPRPPTASARSPKTKPGPPPQKKKPSPPRPLPRSGCPTTAPTSC